MTANKFNHRLLLAAALLPVLLLQACSGASSGHAPGVAGGESLLPGTTNYPLAYVKQPVPTTDIDVRDLITSITGGDLYIRDQASAAGAESNVTSSITLGKGAVRDLDVSPDGSKLVFALRLPLDPKLKNDDPKQPNWKIYQYDALAKTVTQLTTDDITAGHDIGPHYLPDGRIVFASTRQAATQAILLNEGREQYPAQIQPEGSNNGNTPIFLLHVMNADGSMIHQISFNTDHDFAPSVLNNGQIVFSRWETTNGVDQISLYRTNPDGTGLELFYGSNSHATGANLAGSNDNVIQFLNARQRADGKLLAMVRPFLGTQQGGDAVLIDVDDFVENHEPSTPGGSSGTAQASATDLGVTTDANLPSPGGRFHSVYPLYDGTNRMLASWAPCLLAEGTGSAATAAVCDNANTAGTGVIQAPPEYTLWTYDFAAGTLTPLLGAEAGTQIIEPVILQTRSPAATFIADSVATTSAQQDLVANGVGILNIASIYDFDGVDTARPNIAGVSDPAQASFYSRPYRFIRIVHPVEIPNSRTVRKIHDSAFGPAGMGMREILGYAPIQPDGSVSIQVPANVPFTIDILDASGQRVLPRHVNWMQLMPGETKTCNGCHATSASNPTSHGRHGLTQSVNDGAPSAGQSFPGTNPALPALAGEAMATTLARISCAAGSTLRIGAHLVPCSQLLSTDVIYAPVWTTGATVLAGQTDAAVSYLYSDLNTPTPLAEPASCSPSWTAQCRSTIHYPLHVQPLWSLARQTLAADKTVLADHTCTFCHNPASAANSVQVPAGQLDLSSSTSTVDITVLTSYEDLLFPHDEQTLNMGALQDTLVPAPGPPTGPVNPVTGLRTPVLVAVPLTAPIAAGSALDSAAFFSEFSGSGSHNGYLTPAELRLISEWVDDGGQFYNDPFVAPVDN